MVMDTSGLAPELTLYIFASMAATSDRFEIGILIVVPGRRASGGASGISGSTGLLGFDDFLAMVGVLCMLCCVSGVEQQWRTRPTTTG